MVNKKIKFMEEVDYKMELDDGGSNPKELKPVDT